MNAPIYRLENVLLDRRSEQTDFVGPLDLILHLLGKNKLEIKDISVAQIVDQYMDWVSGRQEMDLEVASEFIAMAAQLLYIKSRMLLSVHDEEAQSEMEQLLASLEERQRSESGQRIKLAMPLLRSLFEKGNAYITKGPEALPERRRVYSHERAELLAAMSRILDRSRDRLPPSPRHFAEIVRQEPYPVEQKSGELLARLAQGAVVPLMQLWRDSRSRSELVAVFLSVLELCRSGQLELVWDALEEPSLRLGPVRAEHSA